MIRGIVFMLVFMGSQTWAHPVAFKDSISYMTYNQPVLSDHWLLYSFRSDASIGFRQMRSETKEGRSQFYGTQLSYLFKRWNEPNLQVNVYGYGVYGLTRNRGEGKGTGIAGVQIDAEDRKYFGLLNFEKMFGNSYKFEGRLGVAPYEAEITELASWLMIQYQRHPDLIKKDAITPLVRFFYKSFMLETGVSTEADWMLNFMFHF